ncbi:hypothetical protein F8388_026047 [Cannabis sativa]|uniref:Protein kinase domain-containing protein n=1 Tax=Cannabis sativa TaxID=3483 RepID=A0A7J6ECP2_CANSA|nr:hypothetical protein F8388_026047 [Cannabis sativa]
MDESEEQKKANFPRNILFGKYEMGRQLGQGTFAKVYYGKNLVTGESVAIKVINKDQVKKEGPIDQIKREISVMRLVRHPNIVELKEVMATKGKVYCVMEYVKGGELFAKVLKGKLKEEIARKYFQQLLRNDGLLHTQCGTPAYVAPEILKRKGYDGAKADIWSCGIILFFSKLNTNSPNGFRRNPRLDIQILVVDPEKRISIPDIMKNSWFYQGFTRPIIEYSSIIDDEDKEDEEELVITKSPSSSSSYFSSFYNAFEFISSMSSGFDLSKQEEIEIDVYFEMLCLAILVKLQSVAKKLNFGFCLEKEYKVKMSKKMREKREVGGGGGGLRGGTGARGGGILEIEWDTFEYNKFCEEDVRPALKDIVWSWQGDETLSPLEIFALSEAFLQGLLSNWDGRLSICVVVRGS